MSSQMTIWFFDKVSWKHDKAGYVYTVHNIHINIESCKQMLIFTSYLFILCSFYGGYLYFWHNIDIYQILVRVVCSV